MDQNESTSPLLLPSSEYDVEVSQQQTKIKINVCLVRGIAIGQIFAGILCIAGGVVVPTVNGTEYWVNRTGSGIWCGFWMLLTGIQGVRLSKNPNNRLLHGLSIGFNITAAALSLYSGVLFVAGLKQYKHCTYRSDYEYYDYSHYNDYHDNYEYYDIYNKQCRNKTIGFIVYTTLLIMVLIEICASLGVLIYGCQKIGCCDCCYSCCCCSQQMRGPFNQSVQLVQCHPNAGYMPLSYQPNSIAIDQSGSLVTERVLTEPSQRTREQPHPHPPMQTSPDPNSLVNRPINGLDSGNTQTVPTIEPGSQQHPPMHSSHDQNSLVNPPINGLHSGYTKTVPTIEPSSQQHPPMHSSHDQNSLVNPPMTGLDSQCIQTAPTSQQDQSKAAEILNISQPTTSNNVTADLCL